jgi:hypothetical protein
MYLRAPRTQRRTGPRARLIERMNEVVQAAAQRQKPSGFWAHEYENAFATGARAAGSAGRAKRRGATVPTEMLDKAAQRC